MRHRMTSVLVLVLLSVHTLGLDLEGSGGDGVDLYPSTLQDQEDGGDQDDLLEGSGDTITGFNYDWTKFDTTNSNTLDSDDYYDYFDSDTTGVGRTDNYEYLEEYLEKETESSDSVLQFDDAHDIEIQSKPTESEEEEIVFNMSQIFIMVGSSFISFAIFMFTFFLCRKLIANKQKKSLSYLHATPEKMAPTKEPPIVKDYQKVPTTTQEILKSNPPRIDMYGKAGSDPENPSMMPLVP